jgi:hypothetical protein
VPSVEDRLEAVMGAPLDTLVDPAHQVRPSREAVDAWRLPESDLRALIDHGLPDDLIMTPAFQPEAEPLLVPHVAGPRERELLGPADRLYDLGRWGGHDATPAMGAVRGDGRVLAILPAPVTAADMAEGLREHYRDLYVPAVSFINSSVARLVETSWRWRAAIPLFIELREPPLGCPQEEFDAYLARCEACERIVLTGIERIDPVIPADDPRPLWGELVRDRGC